MRKIRNETHFHFSHKYASAYSKVWDKYSIKGDDFLKVVHYIWDILSFLHEKHSSDLLPSLDYDGEDAKKAAEFVSKLSAFN